VREGLLGGRDHLGEGRVQVHQLLHRHAQALDDAGGDLLGLLPQRRALLGQRQREVALVLRVPLPAQQPGRLQSLEQR
jgi:hypothetical protein